MISLDFSAVATCPKAMPSSLAQALTMCKARQSLLAASCEPRQVLPSMATRRRSPLGVVVAGQRMSVGDPVLEAALESLGLEGNE